MKKLATCFALAIVLVLAGCNTKTLKAVSSGVKNEELGNAMPQILYVNENQLAFWGEFGLFFVDISEQKITDSVDLSKLESNAVQGANHMTGTVITKFWVSQNKESIYLLNTGEVRYSNSNHPEPHEIKTKTLEFAENVTGDLEIEPQGKIYTVELIGGEPGGYMSNIVLAENNCAYYLLAEDWYVKDLVLVKQNLDTNEKEEFFLFSK